MKKIFLVFLLSVAAHGAWSETEGDGLAITQLFVETRMAFQQEMVDGKTIDDRGGFKGRYLNFRIDGQLTKDLTFSYRQRLNKNTDATFFESTDWLHLDWKAAECLSFSAGKQVVAIGGYEYDRPPIDVYTCSEFWNNVACYRMGVSAAYNVSKADQLLFQVCNSPFSAASGVNTYALNLMWYGGHGFWETMWSVNMAQLSNKKWMNYISLGNRFKFSRAAYVDIDIMNRAGEDQTFLMKDWSVVGELSVLPVEGVRCFAKYSHDENKSGTAYDELVHDGTNMNLASLGVEYSPLKKNRDALRLYATGAYSWGDNSNPAGALQDKQTRLEVGMKLKVAKK